MHNRAKRSIRLVLISVASLDGMLKSIAGLSSSIRFAGHTHFINNYLGGKIERECESKMSWPRTVNTMTQHAGFTPDRLQRYQYFELLINIKYYLLLGDTCISVNFF